MLPILENRRLLFDLLERIPYLGRKVFVLGQVSEELGGIFAYEVILCVLDKIG